jgi:glycosyltransferase involved in cell wall biosynthesis
MKFLVLTKKFPYPPIDGESLLVSAFNNVLKFRGHDIDILSYNTIKHFFDPDNMPVNPNPYSNIWMVYLDNRIKLTHALLNLFSPKPFHITRFINKEFEEKLTEILQSNYYDFIIAESIYLHPFFHVIRKYSQAKIILRAHNVEYEIWERLIKTSKYFLVKPYIIYLTSKLKKYELTYIGDSDLLCTLTNRDLNKFITGGFIQNSLIVPAGIEGDNYKPAEIKNAPILKISFIGSLDWRPNSEGIQWFIEKCWLKSFISDDTIELHIAGRNTPQWMFKYQNKNLKIYGEVPDSKEFLNSCTVMIVPLLAGSGMRLKILEALALGRVVITTRIGLEGIEAQDGKEVLIADTPEEFVEKINFCQNNFEAIQNISANAVEFFDNNFKLEKIVDRFLGKLNEI